MSGWDYIILRLASAEVFHISTVTKAGEKEKSNEDYFKG